MPRYAFLVEYDGTPFHGWQRQSGGLASVQGALEAALARLEPSGPAVQGAGRTDTGVHASGQVAHADLSRTWEPFRLAEALNWHLKPAPVAVLACALVEDSFHARFRAVERRYVYRILCRRAPPVLEKGQVWHLRHRLDPALMQDAAAHLVGHHDFTTFRSALCQSASPVKTLDKITFASEPVVGGMLITAELRARSFLHNQVRSIIGTLERVGTGAWAAADVAGALAARDRAACGPVAPPEGLCLAQVRYPADPFA